MDAIVKGGKMQFPLYYYTLNTCILIYFLNLLLTCLVNSYMFKF
jgi:hypothetical protein